MKGSYEFIVQLYEMDMNKAGEIFKEIHHLLKKREVRDWTMSPMTTISINFKE